jgi:hypothetical protein
MGPAYDVDVDAQGGSGPLDHLAALRHKAAHQGSCQMLCFSLRRPALLSLSLVLLSVVVACAGGGSGGGGGGGVDTSQFPSAAEIEAIASRPAPPAAARSTSPVNTWTFQGPFDDTFSDVVIDAPTDFEAPYVAVAGKERFTRAGRCIAREMAAYLVTQVGKADLAWPDGRFNDYLAARCGSFGRFGTQASTYDKLGATTDATVIAEFHKKAAALVDADGDLGVAFVRKGDAAVAVSVSLRVEARIEPTSMKASNGSVLLRGTLVDGAGAKTIYAQVNQGDTAVAECAREPAVAPPRFALRCPVQATDAVAGVALHVHRDGRFLSDALGSGLVLPGGPVALTWSASVWGEATPLPADNAALGELLLTRTNAIRAAAKLPPLTSTPKQSATAARLAPHYFSPTSSSGVTDQIALGMLAGWDLTTPVQDGDFSSFRVGAGGSVDEVLGAALDSPTVRHVLLSPKAGLLALGLYRESGSLNVMTTTWEPFSYTDAAVTQSRVFEALKAERVRRGLAGLGEVGLEPVYAQGSQRLAAGDEPRQVLQDLLGKTVDAMQRNFKGWTIETADPEHIAWPDELLSAQPTYIAVSAGMRQRKGSPWATTVVLIAAFVDTQATMAMASTPR